MENAIGAIPEKYNSTRTLLHSMWFGSMFLLPRIYSENPEKNTHKGLSAKTLFWAGKTRDLMFSNKASHKVKHDGSESWSTLCHQDSTLWNYLLIDDMPTENLSKLNVWGSWIFIKQALNATDFEDKEMDPILQNLCFASLYVP